MAVDVQTPVFEGPFDLLLHLILRDQVDLYEVPLARIVDGYLVELDRMEKLNLELATEFLLIAATLVEMKARRLLPDHGDIDIDDELALWEERDLLLARLVECKTFKDAAAVLDRLHRHAARTTGRCVGPDERFAGIGPDMLEGVTPARLHSAFVAAMTPRPVPRLALSHVSAVRTTVGEAVAELVAALPQLGRTSFRAMTDMYVERMEVVVRFLAVLELFKQGLIDISQAHFFGDIELVWLGGVDRSSVDLALVDSYDG